MGTGKQVFIILPRIGKVNLSANRVAFTFTGYRANNSDTTITINDRQYISRTHLHTFMQQKIITGTAEIISGWPINIPHTAEQD
ncbi:hypothetical protein RTE01_06900 [Raoultella terrigena]|nr:hypothetical protein RTE01_06900 [Raoultella terrigena]